MREFLIWAFAWLIPPHGSDEKRVYRWRVAVAVMTMANSSGLLVAGVLAFGAFPVVFQGFAHSKDVTDMGGVLSEVRRYQIDGKIMDARMRQCALMNAPVVDDPQRAALNQYALLFATTRLQGELEAFTRLMQRQYRLPGCDELLGASAKR